MRGGKREGGKRESGKQESGKREGGTDEEVGRDDGTGTEARRMCDIMCHVTSICSGVPTGALGLRVLASTCLAWSVHTWQARYISP